MIRLSRLRMHIRRKCVSGPSWEPSILVFRQTWPLSRSEVLVSQMSPFAMIAIPVPQVWFLISSPSGADCRVIFP